MFRRAGLSVVAIAASLAIADSALAAERFAEPMGDGPAATCPMSNPCGIETAIEDIAVVAGDTITVLPGDYALPGFGTTLEPEESPVTIRAQPGGARPNIVVGDDALDVSAGDTVRGLYIEGTSGSQTLHASGATVEQMQIHSSGANDVGAILRNGAVLRDSFVSTAMAGDPAVLVDGGGATLSGVTAIGLGVNSRGVEGFPVTQVVTVRNVIARGSGAGPGILAVDDADADNLDINVSFTNYSSIAETTPEADVIEGPGNQTAAPLLVNPALAVPDFHQLTGSPTINMGSSDATTGALDFDGETRIMGAALDIGGDEFSGLDPAPIPGSTPPTVLTPTPPAAPGIAKKCKKKKQKRKTTGSAATDTAAGHTAAKKKGCKKRKKL